MNKANGGMYPWVTHTWNPLLGTCPHACVYCYVQAMARRFPTIKSKYTGTLRLDKKAMSENLGKGKTIFVCNMTDLFASSFRDELPGLILKKCREFPDNLYVFQTKNPRKLNEWILPPNSIVGVTIETDLDPCQNQGNVPSRMDRIIGFSKLPFNLVYKKFISIEPIMEFSPSFGTTLIKLKPDFITIGADSKNSRLPEPKSIHISYLITHLRNAGIEVRIKANLKRLYNEN